MKQLETFRQEIDTIDQALLVFLGKRIILSRRIGRIKKEQGINVIDRARERTILKDLFTKAKKYKIRKNFVEKVWHLIFLESYTAQGEER